MTFCNSVYKPKVNLLIERENDDSYKDRITGKEEMTGDTFPYSPRFCFYSDPRRLCKELHIWKRKKRFRQKVVFNKSNVITHPVITEPLICWRRAKTLKMTFANGRLSHGLQCNGLDCLTWIVPKYTKSANHSLMGSCFNHVLNKEPQSHLNRILLDLNYT